jgi:hypothetical protein
MPGQYLPNVTLVTGPGCAGKNTWVRDHFTPGDLVVDLDAILTALSGRPSHDHDDRLKPYAFEARDAVLRALWARGRSLPHAWIILSAPTELQRRPYRLRVGRVVTVHADRATLLARAGAERPPEWVAYIDQWLASADTSGVDLVVDTSTHGTAPPLPPGPVPVTTGLGLTSRQW